MRGVLRWYWWLAVGVIGVVAGVGLIATSNAWGGSSSEFGWFAYTPLSDSEVSVADEFTSRVDQLWVGVAVAVVGLLVIAVGVGYRLGQRQTQRQRQA
jgi:heme/copper-type cytochrome/quinol oxidase subunit 1